MIKNAPFRTLAEAWKNASKEIFVARGTASDAAQTTQANLAFYTGAAMALTVVMNAADAGIPLEEAVKQPAQEIHEWLVAIARKEA